MKNISILGSTGSIGINALDVIRDNPERFAVVALSAYTNVGLLKQQMETFRPKVVSVADEKRACELKEMLKHAVTTDILFGEEGYCEVASITDANMVVSAMVGSAGLLPTIQAIEAGKDIALANKEVMVMAGSLVIEKARERGVSILPIDSEHSAIFQCIAGDNGRYIKRIILTASGGPFLFLSNEGLKAVKPADALKHPCWQMGRKITIDSATMMNKGLEVIEAKWLFQVDIDNIEVHIHPQSIIHSMVEYIDGSMMAQLSVPDMRIPIAYALSFPERLIRSKPSLDLLKAGRLDFFPPDTEKFPNLRLAYQAGRDGGTAPAVMNAANEIAVEAFLDEKIGFMDISKLIREVLLSHRRNEYPTLEEILEADRWSRCIAREYSERINEI